MSAYTLFENHMARINDLCSVTGLLIWDSRTMMPEGGNEIRGQQVSTLTRLVQERFTSPKTRDLLQQAETELAFRGEPEDSYRWRSLVRTREALEISERIPAELNANLARLKSIAPSIWAKARQENRFSAFLPILEEMMAVQRQVAGVIGYKEHPYDALLSRFEPGMTSSGLKNLSEPLRKGLLLLLDKIRQHEPPEDSFLRKSFPPELQRSFALEIAAAFGYDLQRGRLDPTAHPFAMPLTRQDVRITTRYDGNYLPMALFGILHETGHALYEQNIAPELTRTSLATDLVDMLAMGGVSYGTHESQSRLWENLVGRSRFFWENHYPRLQEYFPDQLGSVDVDQFYRAVNRVQPSYIRVEADEVTYNLHILLRVEIEMELIAGNMREKDLPEIWNHKMKEYLGITPPDDSRGVLQDQHWSSGHIGTFSNYMIGNLMAAQFFQAAQSQVPGLQGNLACGNYKPLLDWLRQNIHRHGKTFTAAELMQRVTGKNLSTEPFLDYLNGKFGELYP